MNGKNVKSSTRNLVMYSILTAVVVLLQFMGSFIRLGPFSVSLVLVPIVIGAALLGAKAGETVADTCAAPGGKSFSIALSMENKGKLYSFDLHDNKISLIKKGAEKLGISIEDAQKMSQEL